MFSNRTVQLNVFKLTCSFGYCNSLVIVIEKYHSTVSTPTSNTTIYTSMLALWDICTAIWWHI